MAHKQTYLQKISLKNKTPEEQERIKKLFEDNINIANKIASKYYKTKYWEFDEALQIARMGLWKACLIWDPDKYRISTLAYNIINRDFIDYDREQKRQPDILFNLEDNCVTDDLSLNDVLIDERASVDEEIMQDTELKELTSDILEILNEIAEDLNLTKSVVKLVYLVYIESGTDSNINLRSISFIKRPTIKLIITELQDRLSDIL